MQFVLIFSICQKESLLGISPMNLGMENLVIFCVHLDFKTITPNSGQTPIRHSALSCDTYHHHPNGLVATIDQVPHARTSIIRNAINRNFASVPSSGIPTNSSERSTTRAYYAQLRWRGATVTATEGKEMMIDSLLQTIPIIIVTGWCSMRLFK